jgi:hypothetical protein
MNSSLPCLSAMRSVAFSTSRIVKPRRSREARKFRPAAKIVDLPSGASIIRLGSLDVNQVQSVFDRISCVENEGANRVDVRSYELQVVWV